MRDDGKRFTIRYREASEDNRNILDGLPTRKEKRAWVGFLREKEWTIFSPTKIDFKRYRDLLKTDPSLHAWIAQETDPVLIAECLAAKYPHIFYTIEQVYEIYTDWKIQYTKSGGSHGAPLPDPLPIPEHLIEALEASELEMVARRLLRKEIKALNRDPKAAIEKINEWIKKTTHVKERKLFTHVRNLMSDLARDRFPAFVSELVAGMPFPSMHVRLWVRQILERCNALIVGDVGTQKTSAAVIGLEELRCRSAIVICRSYAKEMWESEIRRYYVAQMNPYVVQGVRDIKKLERMSPKDLRRHRFIIVGYGNLQFGTDGDDGNPKYCDRLLRALKRLQPDSVIIDEAHAIKGGGARALRVIELAQHASVKHRIMLTATPFENHPNEVAHLAALLDPKNFRSEQEFLAMCRDNPRIFFGLMSKRMCDYFAQEDVLDLPRTNLTIHGYFPRFDLACPKDMREVHDAIQNDGRLEARQQVVRMTRFLAVPPIARNWYPELADAPCFRDPLSNPKIRFLKEQVAKLIKTGKVVIASGIFAAGITREFANADDDSDLVIATLLEQWFPGQVLRIDGSTDRGKSPHGSGKAARQDIQERWQTDPNARILIASVPAAAESLNFALKRVPGSVEKMTIFYLTLPWKPTQYLQFNGRFHRPGTEVPIEVYTLAIKGTADEALLELNERKWKNFLIGVHGMPLLVEEEGAIERATFDKLVCSPSQWLREGFAKMMGMGETGIEEFLQKTLREMPIADTMARYYLENEDRGTPGHVSRIIVPTLQRWHESGVIPSWEDVLDVGPGPLILERKLNAPIAAIEINPRMLDVGRTHSYHGGKNAIEGRASRMPAEWTGRFSLVAASLLLDLTSRKAKKSEEAIERVRILQECHRVLKRDGYLWCVLQKNCFDDESFDAFLEIMQFYGFEPVKPWSNRIEALDHKEHPFSCWSILLRKHTELHDVKPPCPLFVYERIRETKVRKKRPRKIGVETAPIVPDLTIHQQFAIRDGSGTLLSVEEAAAKVGRTAPPTPEYLERLYVELVGRFKLGDSNVAQELRKQIVRIQPRSQSDLKEVWKRIRSLPGAPHVSWAVLNRVARPFFLAS